MIREDGTIWSKGRWGKEWSKRKVGNNNQGYPVVGLWVDKNRKYFLVSRLVLRAFVGPCPKGMECCHNDGDPTNNHLSNLRWDSHSNNIKDAVRQGTFVPPGLSGEKCGASKLKRFEVDKIREMYATGEYTQKGLGELFGVSGTQIRNLVTGKHWR